MKTYSLISLIPSVLLLASCTGDPTRGGIFWSEAKAQERQAALINTQSAKLATFQTEQTKRTNLQNQITAVQRQIAAKKKRLNQISESPETGNLSERARLIQEIAALEKELAEIRSSLQTF